MKTQGVVHNGVIVIDGGIRLPEGTRIVVSIEPEMGGQNSNSYHVQFPLVHSETPGQLQLTNETISQFLDEDEIPR